MKARLKSTRKIFKISAVLCYQKCGPIIASTNDIEFIQDYTWIKVEDRLPENKTVVLVRDRKNDIHLAYLITECYEWINKESECSLSSEGITHWMPK